MKFTLITIGVLGILLATPFVQTKIGGVATSYLRSTYDVDIAIDQIKISVFGNASFKKVHINDHHGDTLIFAERIDASLYSFYQASNGKLDFGAIALADFKLHLKTYQGEQEHSLTVFENKISGEESDQPSGFLLKSEKLILDKGYVEILDENLVDKNGEIEPPLYFKEISGYANKFIIEGPNVSAFIKDFSFVENHDLHVEKMTTDFSYSLTGMRFLNTIFQTATSEIKSDIYFDYNREDFSDFNNRVKIKAVVHQGDVSLLDAKKFYEELGEEDVLHFTTIIEGNLNDFTARDLLLTSNRNAIIKGDLKFLNVFNREKDFVFNGELVQLVSDYNHLKTLLPNILGRVLPSTMEELGRFEISGPVHITKNVLNTNIRLKTDLGLAVADLELVNLDNVDEAHYVGRVKLKDVNLGYISNNPLIGLLSLEADIDGQGFTFGALNTSVRGTVSKYQYNGYSYNNIGINGRFRNRNFNGEMEVNDENIKLNFNGLADFSRDVYTFDFKANIDYCDLKAINIFKRDSISNVKGEIDINLVGNSLDDITGTVEVKNSLYTNQKDNYFFQNFNITSLAFGDERRITVNSSEIVEGYLSGNFSFAELGHLAQNSLGSIYSNYTPIKVTSGQYLEFEFKIYNKIVEVFYPEVVLAPNTFIRGEINSDEGLFKLNLESPKIETSQAIIDKLNLVINNKNPLFDTQLVVDRVYSNVYDITDLRLLNKTLNDTLFFRTEFKGGKQQTEQFDLAFFHTINKQNNSVFGVQESKFNFKKKTWNINPLNKLMSHVLIDRENKMYKFNPLTLLSKEQEITFFGSIHDTISKELNFNFKNVQLANITPNIDSLMLDGKVNGEFNYHQLYNEIKPKADLTIQNFKINKSKQGDLMLNIEGDNSIQKYRVNSKLTLDNNISFLANGELDFAPDEPQMDISFDFERFKLDAFSPLGEDVFNSIRGYAYGSANLKGAISNPVMEGALFLDNAGMYFPYLAVDYDFEGTSVILLQDKSFIMDDVVIKDVVHNSRGRLTGDISHKNFKDWFLNLHVNTRNLLVLNTEETETSLYYGTGFLNGTGTIAGPTDKLIIDVQGATNDGTYFVIPISDVKTAERSELIRFVEKDKLQDDDFKRKEFISQKMKGLQLNVDLEVTKDAIVEIVLDKTSGSFLRGSGTGNFQIQLDTKDKFDMFGDFIIDNGVYNFKYGGFITKPFIIEKDGNISWSGDPFTADINIQAIHRVNANPRTLLENVSANRKIPIDLITRFSGELFDSNIEMDIEIPNSSSTVASELEFKIQNNVTTQFISLLVSGSFYNEDFLGTNSNAVLYGTGIDMLTNAFDNIFNQGDSKFKFKPVYTLGEKSAVDNVNIDDQLAIALDYQVNDRILINGKLGMPIGTNDQSTVIGEVNIDFLMNDDGSLRSSVFNRQNEIQYTEEEEGYTQGIGITYQIDFDNSKELFNKIFKKKVVVQDTIAVKKVIDSLSQAQKLINFKKN